MFIRHAVLILVAVTFLSRAHAQDDVPKVDKDALIEQLSTGSEESRQAAVDSLDQYGADPLVAEALLAVLEKTAIRGRVPDSTLLMIRHLGNFPGNADVVTYLNECLDSSNNFVVMMSVDALGELGDSAALDALITLSESSTYQRIYGFRKCVIQAVMKIEDRRSIDFLLAQLPKLDGQLEFDVVRHLTHLSLQPFGREIDNWNQWWHDNQPDFDFTENDAAPDSSSSTSPEFRWDRDDPQFFGEYIYARRLVFVIDISNSMKKLTGDKTRLERAKAELIAAIEALSEEKSFSIIAFHKSRSVWRSRLVVATEANRKGAVNWVSSLEPDLGTASYDALDDGFKIDSNTEAIFFLSDGAPWGGTIEDKDEIVRVLTRANFFRRIAVSSFGVGVQGKTEKFMRQLAEKNGGAYVGVR